jgi:hypothetical protein
MSLCLKYTSIYVIVVFLFLLFSGRSFPQLKLIDIGRNCLLGNRKKIAKFLMRTFTYHSTFLYDLKGVGHEISTSGFVNESVSPWPLSILLGSFNFFMKIRGDICNFILLTPAISCSLVSRTPLIYFRRVIVAADKLFPVSLTPVIIYRL